MSPFAQKIRKKPAIFNKLVIAALLDSAVGRKEPLWRASAGQFRPLR
jgi:hypothetical protein